MVGSLGALGSALFYVGTAATVAGAGYSAYSSHQQGKAAKNAANYNYALQTMQNKAAMSQQRYQTASMQQQANINQAMANAEAQARNSNYELLRNQAEVQASNQQENIRKQRLEQERMTAIQRARIAGSGVVESGSPLEVMAASAGEMEQQLNEMHYQSNIDRSQGLRQADLEQFGGQMTAAGGAADANLLRMGAQAESLKGQSQYRAGVLSANINRMAGMDQSKAYNTQAAGSLLSGAGAVAGQWSSWRYSNPNTTANYGASPGTGSMSGYGKSISARY